MKIAFECKLNGCRCPLKIEYALAVWYFKPQALVERRRLFRKCATSKLDGLAQEGPCQEIGQMLRLTDVGTAHTCDGVTRRDFLQAGALGAIGLSLPELLAAEQQAKRGEHDDRSCIMIFNLGAPSQMDTFDPKPEAAAEIRGPFKPISTKGDFQITEILPRHAQIADKFSVVRSCYHNAAAVHDTGHQMLQTGRLFQGGVNTPHVGAAVAYLRGRKTDLPAHAILPEPMGSTGGNLPHGQDAGFLGKAYDPFLLMADPSQPNFKVPDLLPPAELGDARLERRRKLRDIVEEKLDQFEASPQAKLMDSSFDSAYRLMTSPQARSAFDLSKEPQKVRDRYGNTRFGQCCLLARRLIEAGVRVVTVNTFLTVFNEITWDIHGSKPFTSIEGMRDIVAPMYDQAYSAACSKTWKPAACWRKRWFAIWLNSAARRGSTPPAVATTGRNALALISPVAEFKAAAPSAAATPSAPIRPNAPPNRRKSSPRSTRPSASIWKPSCPVPPVGRSPWSISASMRLRNSLRNFTACLLKELDSLSPYSSRSRSCILDFQS
jgi:hypothetical protein